MVRLSTLFIVMPNRATRNTVTDNIVTIYYVTRNLAIVMRWYIVGYGASGCARRIRPPRRVSRRSSSATRAASASRACPLTRSCQCSARAAATTTRRTSRWTIFFAISRRGDLSLDRVREELGERADVASGARGVQGGHVSVAPVDADDRPGVAPGG